MRRALLGVALVVPAIVLGWSPGRAASGPAASHAGAQATGPRGTITGQPTGTAVLRGVVVAADTGAPLRRAEVRAFSAGGEDNRMATSDDDGRFELRELTGGRYTLTASKGGFVTLQAGQRRPGERGTPIELAAGQTIEKIVIALPRGGVITGRITDEFGEPAVGAQVQVMRYVFARGSRRLQPSGRGDATDDQGTYRIYGLNPGDYYVSATMRSGMMMTINGRLSQDDAQGYAPTFYPGTPSRTDAERVTVGVGQEVAGVTFGLTPTRVSRISGRVVGLVRDSTDAFVMAMPEDGAMGVGGMRAGAQVEADGTFVLSGVPPGRYVLQVQPRGRREEDDLVGMTTVTVAGADLGNVVITLQRPGTISGRIEFEGGTPASVRPSQVRVFPSPVDPAVPPAFVGGPPQTHDDFTFTVRGAMGPVMLQPDAPPGWHLKSVVLDGQDVTDLPLSLTAGTNVKGVRVLLTRSVTTLSGSVRDDRGALVLDATVIVFPDDEARWSAGARRIRTGRPDTQGRFELTGLPPSPDYRVVAVQGLEEGQAYDPEFLAGQRDRAERLSLAEGETKTLELRLRP